MGARAVFLVGFMGCGKNAVGRHLADRLRWNFVDLDAEIERRERQTIAEIFQSQGEPAFRAAETSALRDLLATSVDRTVIALGGGTFAQNENRALLVSWPTVFLDAPIDELWRRCQPDVEGSDPSANSAADRTADGTKKDCADTERPTRTRPLARDRDHFHRLHAERLPFYRQATVRIQTNGKQLPSICSEIEKALRLSEASESL